MCCSAAAPPVYLFEEMLGYFLNMGIVVFNDGGVGLQLQSSSVFSLNTGCYKQLSIFLTAGLKSIWCFVTAFAAV